MSMKTSLAALVAAMLVPAAAMAVTVRLDRTVVQAATPGRAQCQPTSGAENAAIASATSDQRRGRGLKAVRPSARLAQAAARHACDMARRGLMAHHGSTTRGPAQRVRQAGYHPALTAENIAAGPFGLAQVLGVWNQSPGHRHNILLPEIREVGIGRAVAEDGRTVFWAAVYAAPR